MHFLKAAKSDYAYWVKLCWLHSVLLFLPVIVLCFSSNLQFFGELPIVHPTSYRFIFIKFAKRYSQSEYVGTVHSNRLSLYTYE